MIKLFRNIRQNLLNEGKTTKYVKYAIGEIVLVVIGILIALQINNWNENRKANIEETAILESLHENLILAKQQSEALIAEEKVLKQSLIFVLGIEANPVDIEKQTITDSIFKDAVWNLQSDLPTINTYTNIKNTDKLSLIKSKTINEKFSDLDFRLNKLNNVLEDRLSVHQIRIDNILENDINFIPLVKSTVTEISITNETTNNYNEILSDKRIRNLLGMKLDFTQDVIDFRENLDIEMKQLICLIEAELNE
ncbi:hypothetical protein ADIWIN_0741 [Winogradskyella psychrotolerans RS-3]|uniref:Uncharacterized protein n=1 Tax=Winogradskyella psychrotolerans RS-3 TaxID=641526 RepID=S7X562_9FLAO|nr:DUF6090 family protein [Winogradskyella psychrotolerans]EPR74164.1 hypothetical protein ADIWIN_0741 [Winogradskyella psychrotolerans RS-3]